jgi:hypothetical protein
MRCSSCSSFKGLRGPFSCGCGHRDPCSGLRRVSAAGPGCSQASAAASAVALPFAAAWPRLRPGIVEPVCPLHVRATVEARWPKRANQSGVPGWGKRYVDPNDVGDNAASAGAPSHVMHEVVRRDPSRGVVNRVLRAHVETFLARYTDERCVCSLQTYAGNSSPAATWRFYDASSDSARGPRVRGLRHARVAQCQGWNRRASADAEAPRNHPPPLSRIDIRISGPADEPIRSRMSTRT